MKLPIEISPSPLVLSIVEIRFESEMESVDMFPKIYSQVLEELPKVTQENNIPKELKDKDPQFLYVPDYVFTGADYVLGITGKSIAFEHIAEYKLWKNYSSFISKHLEKILSMGMIAGVFRIGLRYASIFEGKNIKEVLKTIPTIGIENEQFNNYSSNFSFGENNLFVQISDQTKIQRKEKTMVGLYIDIDASFYGNLGIDTVVILNKINELHSLEKEMFFSLLKPEFVKSLNPKY